jgi:hypothetical protein
MPRGKDRYTIEVYLTDYQYIDGVRTQPLGKVIVAVAVHDLKLAHEYCIANNINFKKKESV